MNAGALRRRVRAATADLQQKIAELEESEGRNQAALAEKEVLLKEIHHRVKNNLQIVSSLIQLKSDELHDEGDRLLLVDIRQRILVLAQLHELLYQSRDLASIDAAEYLDAIARDTARAYSWSEMTSNVEHVILSIDEALPLGLVADELLVNAMKYAYPFDTKGQIRLVLYRDDDSLVLRVEDDGVGLPPGLDPSECDSMGFTIVRGLAEQLSGGLAFLGPPGFGVELRIPTIKPARS
jgi:two-component sensor histidine kinase